MTEESFEPVARVLDDGEPLVTIILECLDGLERDWARPQGPHGEDLGAEPDWNALRALDFDGEYLRLCEWLHRVLSGYQFPPEVNGLFLQLLYPPPGDKSANAGFYLAGSSEFREDYDWARDAMIPGDDFFYLSETLTSFYRLIAHVGDDPIFPRDRAIYLLLVFVSAVCADWSKTLLRHKIRGRAVSRGMFIGLDPWMGFVIQPKGPDRYGGHGSVVVDWSGRCEDKTRQAAIITELRGIARWHEEQWNETPEGRSAGWLALATLRGMPIPVERPLIRTWDQDLTGRVFVSPDLGGDRFDLLEEARRRRLKIETVDVYGRKQELLLLSELGVRGIDFRVFDPRTLYPSEDRISFVFLESREAPFLNGLIASVEDRAFTAKVYVSGLQTADWWVQGPGVHLRDYMEEWSATFLAWLRFFHLPDFEYRHRGDSGDDYESFRRRFGAVRGRLGPEAARDYFAQFLKLYFKIEAERIEQDLL